MKKLKLTSLEELPSGVISAVLRIKKLNNLRNEDIMLFCSCDNNPLYYSFYLDKLSVSNTHDFTVTNQIKNIQYNDENLEMTVTVKNDTTDEFKFIFENRIESEAFLHHLLNFSHSK